MQIVAFISAKGGVGKTTLTANMAVALGLEEKRVLALDLDPQNALGRYLGLYPTEPWGIIHEGIAEDSLYRSPFGISFLPFGKLHPDDFLRIEQGFRRNVNWLRDALAGFCATRFDYVLIDTASLTGSFLKQALHAADHVIAVVQPDPASLIAMEATLALTEDLNGSAKTHLVVNQLPIEKRLALDVYSNIFTEHASKLAPFPIHYDVSVVEALAYERPVLYYEPNCIASIDIANLAKWLIAYN